MNTQNNPRMTAQELTTRTTKYIEELAETTDKARVSEEMLRYLEACSRFHQYSWCNTLLILMSCPQATQVAGYRQWQSLNRYVRKGEKGISILAPIIVTAKGDEEIKEEGKNVEIEQSPKRFLRGFKVVHVFDVSQTDGEPLPEPPDWKSPEKNAELQERLVAFAMEKGITVAERQLAGEIQGVSRGGAIELSPTAGTSTLIHEIAHELLHKLECHFSMTRDEKELEAEAVAFVVGKHFGLEVNSSANYIAMWNGGKDAILARLERIQVVAKEVITGVGADNLDSKIQLL